jgi:hypothetical protein
LTRAGLWYRRIDDADIPGVWRKGVKLNGFHGFIDKGGKWFLVLSGLLLLVTGSMAPDGT